MKFHKYGPVEIAIERGQGDDHETTYGRILDEDVCYLRVETDEVAFDEETGFAHPVERWFDCGTLAYPHENAWGTRWELQRATEPVPVDLQSGIPELLDAGATLCWHEYERFQAADRAMGDPNP